MFSYGKWSNKLKIFYFDFSAKSPAPDNESSVSATDVTEESDSDEEPDIFFSDANQLLDIFSELEEQNLSLIQNSQETEEALEEMKQQTKITQVKMEKETSILKEQIDKLERAIDREETKAKDLEVKARSLFELRIQIVCSNDDS